MVNISQLSNRKTPRWLLWLLISIIFLTTGYLLLILNPIVVRYGDYVQYWAAGRLTIAGENPYSADLVLGLRNEANVSLNIPVEIQSMILYPPWSLPLLIPFGVFNYEMSRFLWFIFQLVISFFAAIIIWNMYKGPKKNYRTAILIAFLFFPTLYLLLMGHLTSLHLIGVLGFLYFTRNSERSRFSDLAAGACVALVTIKPQLLVLFLLALLFWVVEKRRWWILIGSGVIIFMGSIIPLLFNPNVIFQYWTALSTYPVGAWASPAIGTVVRRTIGYHIEWLQILPTFLGLIWLVYYWFKYRLTWDWFTTTPILIFASYLFSPYYWPYDMIVMLLPVLVMFSILLKMTQKHYFYILFSLYLLIFAVTVFQFLFIRNDYYYFWLAAAYALLYYAGMWLLRKDPFNIHSEVTLAY